MGRRALLVLLLLATAVVLQGHAKKTEAKVASPPAKKTPAKSPPPPATDDTPSTEDEPADTNDDGTADTPATAAAPSPAATGPCNLKKALADRPVLLGALTDLDILDDLQALKGLTAFLPPEDELKTLAAEIGSSDEGDALLEAILRFHFVNQTLNRVALNKAGPIRTLLKTNSPCPQEGPVQVKTPIPTISLEQGAKLGLVVGASTTGLITESDIKLCANAYGFAVSHVLNPCCATTAELVEGKKPFFPSLLNETNGQNAGVQEIQDEIQDSVEALVPGTTFVPTDKAFNALKVANIGANSDNDTATLYKYIGLTHLSPNKVDFDLLGNRSVTVNVTTGLSRGYASPACRQVLTITMHVKSANATVPAFITERTNASTAASVTLTPLPITVDTGDVKANVLNILQDCNGNRVFVVDKVLVPCGLEQISETAVPAAPDDEGNTSTPLVPTTPRRNRTFDSGATNPHFNPTIFLGLLLFAFMLL